MLRTVLGLIGAGVVILLLIAGKFVYDILVHKYDWQPAIAPAPSAAALPRAPCADHAPLRNAYFGDLHVHTTYSWDGAGRGINTTPDQAYRFALGQAVGLPPYDNEGNGLRSLQLERPLDFAAVTDHSETFGEVNLCITPGSARFDSEVCRGFRGEETSGLIPLSFSLLMRKNTRGKDLCGEDALLCRQASLNTWNLTQQAAEDWYDRSSDCSFTTFKGYEYSWDPAANRVHRNVIFRNDLVPELPVSAVDEVEPEGLWLRLQQLCLDTDGDCDVMTIPHNPNHASGMMFPLGDPADPVEERRARAQLAAKMEPLLEMMQVKGESECRNGLWGVTGAPDEFCNLEKYTPDNKLKDCEGDTGKGFSAGSGCISRQNFARYVVGSGLAEEREIGVNPYKLGFIGSTDTHNGTPGAVDEWAWKGSIGLYDDTLDVRLKPPIVRNPGGLVGIWAEENSRDSLFDAMRRREVFATSGPRITMRFFAGWDDFASEEAQPVSWCERPDALQAGYDSGVPMGSELIGSGNQRPYFAISAQRDPGTAEHPGGLLQRVQVIKVRAEANGDVHQQVYDVSGGPNDASVDTNTCAPMGAGADNLCTVWQDPDFDPEQSAAYYVRVVENPSCRWTTWSCLATPEGQRPAACNDPAVAKTTQERGWSSPIWYTPKAQ